MPPAILDGVNLSGPMTRPDLDGAKTPEETILIGAKWCGLKTAAVIPIGPPELKSQQGRRRQQQQAQEMLALHPAVVAVVAAAAVAVAAAVAGGKVLVTNRPLGDLQTIRQSGGPEVPPTLLLPLPLGLCSVSKSSRQR